MKAIGWIDRGGPQGRWGSPADLALPADARGLLLAEGVFETVLIEAGAAQLLGPHLRRWQDGAQRLGLAPPPGAAQIDPLVQEAVRRSGITDGAMRLNWCRGSGPRGLQPAAPDPETGQNHLCWLQLSAAAAVFEPVTVILSPSETRSATSLLSRCKSFGYGSALVARRQAAAAGADDALLASSDGSLCCATAANLLIRSSNGWLTPALSSGCLPGIMRQRALDLGLASEARIGAADLLASPGALLLNSLGCRPIRSQGALAPSGDVSPSEARQLWRHLLESSGAPTSTEA